MNQRKEKGLTTGQCAQYCLVTPATIANWIKAGRLPAQRTAGGQYRVRRCALRRFMVATGMPTDILDNDVRPFCWEWMSDADARLKPACLSCEVRRSSELNCFSHHPDNSAQPCETCSYFGCWSPGQPSTRKRTQES